MVELVRDLLKLLLNHKIPFTSTIELQFMATTKNIVYYFIEIAKIKLQGKSVTKIKQIKPILNNTYIVHFYS